LRGIAITRYAQCQKIAKPNNLKVLGARKARRAHTEKQEEPTQKSKKSPHRKARRAHTEKQEEPTQKSESPLRSPLPEGGEPEFQ
jgi:hypothetical protein